MPLKSGHAPVDQHSVRELWGQPVRTLTVLAVVVLVPVLAMGMISQAQPVMPERIHLYVAVPADQEIVYAVADAALHEAELAMTWLEAQVGQELSRRPAAFAEIVQLPQRADELVGDVRNAFTLIHEEVIASVDDPTVFPLILADVRTEPATQGLVTCGLGGVAGVVMFLRNCPDHDLSSRSTWGSAASFTIAHELVHGFGAVEPCAPNATPDGHVTDDPRDLMFAGSGPRVAGAAVVLDAGRDDYLHHGIDGCPDIADSPLWIR